MNRAVVERVVLVCTDCQHVFEPDLVAQVAQTGCERCGGWTWISELSTSWAPAAVPGQREAEQSNVSMGEKR